MFEYTKAVGLAQEYDICVITERWISESPMDHPLNLIFPIFFCASLQQAATRRL